MNFDPWSYQFVSFYKIQHKEEEVATHYDWISTLLQHALRGKEIPIEIPYFETESMREYKIREDIERPIREQAHKEWLEKATFPAADGDYILTENYGVQQLILVNGNKDISYNTYSGFELKNDLKPGKRRTRLIWETQVQLVFTKQQLAEIKNAHKHVKNKEDLIKILILDNNSLPLKYRKPAEEVKIKRRVKRTV
ncbi:hypothetical protein [Fibrella aquatica]|uniref:hypothetical protein n=1 Tax=Fibrella aquatica TaxID=3242487 RepID=UPI003520E033